MALKKKVLTKLLNDDFRAKMLRDFRKLIADKSLQIPQYARYTCDLQILHRSKEFENDKKACYGFSPINFLCAIHKDGHMSKRLYEFNIVNHFLKLMEGEKAVEVVEILLADMARCDTTISSFDIDKIDAELKRIEDEYLKAEAAKKAAKELEASKESTCEEDNKPSEEMTSNEH